MLTKRRFFASALLALVLLSAAACAQIDLAPYEIPDSAMARITLIQPGLFLIHHDSTMNDGTVPTSIILYQNGQPVARPPVRPSDRQRAVSAAPTDGSSSFRPAYEFRNRLSL